MTPRSLPKVELGPLIPAIVLCLVAGFQFALTRTAGLAPWKGGGFGMFSTTDSGTNRKFGIRVSTGEEDRLVPLTSEFGSGFYEGAMLPSKERLTRIARQVAAVESRRSPVSRVHVAVWRVSYDPITMAPRHDLVRDVIVDFDPSTAPE